uniref:Uncharacterized protein n=1 Tax=Oryza brachyantha TaxID=4533 RepID=J3L017_ORYBR
SSPSHHALIVIAERAWRRGESSAWTSERKSGQKEDGYMIWINYILNVCALH